MRAQVFYGPGDLRFEEAPVPEPGPGEVVLRIEAALTCGTDVKTLRRGHPVMIPRVPTVFGHEFAGTVAAVGSGISGVRPGDRAVAANSAPCGACAACRRGQANLCDDLLFVNGAYAEYIALPPRLVARNLVTVPPAAEAARVAFAEPVACCLRAIDAAGLGRGRRWRSWDMVPSASSWDCWPAPAARGSCWPARRGRGSTARANSASPRAWMWRRRPTPFRLSALRRAVTCAA